MMTLRKTLIFLALSGLVTALCGPARAMDMSFEWGPTKKCFDGKSPPITLSGVPAGTAKLRFRMTDLDAPNFNHGGATVAYGGQKKLAYGAFRYRGPCPPSPHVYEIRVDALDAKGKVIAKAKARRRFP